MLRRALPPIVAALALAGAAQAQMVGPSPAGGPGAVRQFIGLASASDAFEVQEGRLAQRRAHDPRVRAFASEMVSAHTRTTRGLKAAIGRTHMPPPRLSRDQSRMLNQLSSARGRMFDRTYMDQQVQAHQDAEQVIGGFAQGGPPGPIRDAAAKTLPIVQHHLEMARQLQRQVR
jgi:putative membrane protein